MITYRYKIVVLITLLLACNNAYAQPKISYRDIADTVIKNINRYFYDPHKKLYKEKLTLKKNERPWSYLWPVCALLQTADEWNWLNPTDSLFDHTLQIANKYYNAQKAPLPAYDSYLMEAGGDDRFYDDNQWIGIACMDAFQRTQNGEYLQIAKNIYDFMLTGYDSLAGGGLYWKEGDKSTKNTCSNAPGAILALQLYKATGQQSFKDTALLLYHWVHARLKAKDELYYDAVQLPGQQIDTRKFTYNTGTMLQSAVMLFELEKDSSYLKTAQAMAASSLQYFYRNHFFPENYWFNAVLLRGYEALYQIDGNATYLKAMAKYVEKVWRERTDTHRLIVQQGNATLIDQAGFAELLLRLNRLLPL
jgi:hypothetical protein